MENVWTHDYEVSFQYIDNRGIARPSFYFDMMQDVATLHAAAFHVSREEQNIIWVLTRCRFMLNRPLLPYEKVRCSTWCPGFRGAVWYRNFSFDVGNEQVGSALSMWAILDPTSHRILRPTALPDLSSLFRGELSDALPRLSCDNVHPHGIHPVVYSDLDVNNHVNNVKIVDMACDALDLNLESGFVQQMQVNYTAETAPGQKIELLRGQYESKPYIAGAVDGKTHFEATVHFAPMP